MLIHNSRHIVIPALAGLRVHTPRGGAAAAWWQVAGVTCLVAYQAKGASSYAASKVNLAQPGTYDAVDGATPPTWAALTGWTGAATSVMSLTTGLSVAKTYTIACEVANQTSTTSNGSFVSCSANLYIARINTSGVVWWNNGALTIGTIGINAGRHTLIALPTAAYIDDVSDGALAGTGTSGNLIIGSGALGAKWSCDIIALAVYNQTLSSAQKTALTTAMAAL